MVPTKGCKPSLEEEWGAMSSESKLTPEVVPQLVDEVYHFEHNITCLKEGSITLKWNVQLSFGNGQVRKK